MFAGQAPPAHLIVHLMPAPNSVAEPALQVAGQRRTTREERIQKNSLHNGEAPTMTWCSHI